MCFSATASFAAAATLVPCGIVTIRQALDTDRRRIGIACFPLFFGVQQAFEAIVWLGIDAPSEWPLSAAALVFLFFAYWFWPVWVPASACLIEPDGLRRRVFTALALVGIVFGAVLYLPVLANPDGLTVTLVRNSLVYTGDLLFHGEMAKQLLRVLYAMVICIPLMASSRLDLRRFGYLIAASVLISFLVASYAFTSIWCFMAAILSAYILVVFRGLKRGSGAWDSPSSG
ncbi:hypothetical protein QO034_13815 [Sedimentitalea sp. JM2-8]|uniref:Uncharacterized protein n=1 Tax=Sedimentitalea xiamensis TaxID=3050037 RepID=A0ABT7FGC4_9RHOB|nr:DUF6629 family protein [Sedimentitalea xiamensis]MDK3074191.1 hypothetical protein [Sedimentitalea xiamensis]